MYYNVLTYKYNVLKYKFNIFVDPERWVEALVCRSVPREANRSGGEFTLLALSLSR